MELLYFVITIMALALMVVGEKYYALKRQLVRRKTIERIERQTSAVYWARVVTRLGLRNIKLPTATHELYRKLMDLYDDLEFIVYPQRIKWARSYDQVEYTYYWDVETIDDLSDDELIGLWLEGIIEGPKQNLEVTK